MTKNEKREHLLEALRATEHLGNPYLAESIRLEIERIQAEEPTDYKKTD